MALINEELDAQERVMNRNRQEFQPYPRTTVNPQRLQEFERAYTQEEVHQFEKNQKKYDQLLKRKDPLADKAVVVKATPIAGWRQDKFDWNISGANGGDPNVATEYIWRDLKSYQLGGKAKITLNNKVVLDGLYKYGWLYSGTGRVFEYDGNNRTRLASEVKADASTGHTMDLSGGVGYKMYLGNKGNDFFDFEQTWLTFLAGYAYHTQHLNLKKGEQIYDSSGTYTLGPFPGLDSPYTAEWKGPWLGLEFAGDMTKRISGDFRFQYHFAGYNSEGQLNLNPNYKQPKSFSQSGDGHGLVFNVGMDYRLSKKLFLNLDGSYENWSVVSGQDEAYLTGGGTQHARLNNVNWKNYGVTLGATYQFQ